VFKQLAKNNEKVENESKAIGEEIINRLIEIGLESKPCHQDLYHANFVYMKEKAYLIDWEYSSQGDPFFDYADLIWQNELEDDEDSINDIYKRIGIKEERIKVKFELFQVLSMITWGFWAKRKFPQRKKGEEVLLLAIKRYENNFS
jgi:thiamine kinase-like enzyme